MEEIILIFIKLGLEFANHINYLLSLSIRYEINSYALKV